jgi:magnesium-transporting ATPase (P-type)
MAYETFGGQGERVLGFAMHELDEKTYGPDKDGTWSMEVEAEEKANAGAAPAASAAPVKTQVPLSGYTFLGLVSLVDPPKNGVLEAVGEVRTAGVKVIMVTGDHPLTAASIARQVGIITGLTKEEIVKLQATSKANAGNEDAMRLLNELQLNPDDAEAVVVTGPELEKFTEPDWNRSMCGPV